MIWPRISTSRSLSSPSSITLWTSTGFWRLAAQPVDFPFSYDTKHRTKNEIHLVAAGRLTEQKGFDLLIGAIALSGLKGLRVTVLGEGPLREPLEELARSKGVEHQIRFIGFQKNPYAFMMHADAFVLSSRHEGFPNVILEALACGTAVIATPAPGGINEIMLATGGVRMASAVTAEALSIELKQFAENGRTTARISLEKFYISKIVREYEYIFRGETGAFQEETGTDMLADRKPLSDGIASNTESRNNTLSKLPIIVMPIIIIPLVYLDIPSYWLTVDPLSPPKYWYYGFAVISLPALLVALNGRGGFLAYPFTQWAIAMVSLMSVHLLLAIFDGETERTNIIQTDIQYIILGALLGIAFSAVQQRYYKFLFPILSIAINAVIILDFLNPGGFYAYDQSTAVLGRGAGTFINPNRAGEALIITLLFSICFFKGRNLLFVLIVCGVGALLTFSRSAIIAWLLLWPFALYLKKLPSYAYGVVTSLFFIVPSFIAIVISYVLSSSEFTDASANILERLDFFEKFSLVDQSAQGRSALLWDGIEAFLEHPFFGIGSGADRCLDRRQHSQSGREARCRVRRLRLGAMGLAGSYSLEWKLVWQKRTSDRYCTILHILLNVQSQPF